MRIGRAIIIPAIIALSAAGSIVAAAAPAASASTTPSVHMLPVISNPPSFMHYHA